MGWYEKFKKVNEIIGNDKFILEVANYFPTNLLEEFIDDLIMAYDLEKEFK